MDFQLEQATPVLERTPTTLRALLEGLDDAWLRADEGAGTFTPFDVVGHLIDADETNWLPRARLILASSEPVMFQPFDRFRHRTRNAARDLPSLLEAFTQLRAANLTEVRGWNLSPADLERRGLHPEFGTVTLRQLLATWVAHDLGHIAQVVRVMAKQYRDEVGPWATFLPLLSDREPKG
jgi:hypothetical protein